MLILIIFEPLKSSSGSFISKSTESVCFILFEYFGLISLMLDYLTAVGFFTT
jgi:hypothetical protein